MAKTKTEYEKLCELDQQLQETIRVKCRQQLMHITISTSECIQDANIESIPYGVLLVRFQQRGMVGRPCNLRICVLKDKY